MDDRKRELKLRKLAAKLSNGESVSAAEIRTVLTAEEQKEYENNWKLEKSNRKIIIPDSISIYQKYYRAGTLLYNRKEAMYRDKLDGNKVLKMAFKAEAKLEWALRLAQECVDRDKCMLLWFDRDPREAHFGSPSDMPHISSKKKCRYAAGMGEMLRIRDCKEIAINDALKKLQSTDTTLDLAFIDSFWITRKSHRKLDFTGFRFS